MKQFIFLCLVILTTVEVGYTQLTVKPVDPVTNKLYSIVKSLVGHDVKVSNITSNFGVSSKTCGTFLEPSNQLGITSGLLMTTGAITNAIGPNNKSDKSAENGTAGDGDLTNLLNAGLTDKRSTYDACVIEFDITTHSSMISFNYIFASEEYPEFVGTEFNDVFAFFISGPGIFGIRNIALLPGSITPITINNVNNNANNSYYHDNGNGIFGGGPIVQYDGYTVKLKAVANVTPCNTYHLKLAIADVSDHRLDSGVFIEAGSLSGSDALVIGNTYAPDSLHMCSIDLPVKLKAGKVPVTKYEWFDDGIKLPVATKTFDVTASGWYKVKAYRDPTCFWKDSIKITVDQDFSHTTSPDTAICVGGSASLDVLALGGNSGYTYLWSPGKSLSNDIISNPIATPGSTTNYSVVVTEGACSHTDTVKVTVLKPITLKVANTINDCLNAPIQLNASGAENYVWTPGINLNDSTLASPIATLNSNTTFQVKGYNNCFSSTTNVSVSVSPIPPVNAYKDTAICFGGTAYLSSDFFNIYQYSWTPAATLDNALLYNPTATPKTTTNYILKVDNNGCIKRDTVHVIVGDNVKAKIYLPFPYGPIPWEVRFRNMSVGATSYIWYFTGFDSTTVKEPTIKITQENYYTVVLKAVNGFGCYDYDTLILQAYNFFIPNLITPNGDNLNDTFEISGISNNFSVEIYNRWGERVYKNANYRNEWNGEGLSDGIYYYFINDPLYEEEYKGWVQLIR